MKQHYNIPWVMHLSDLWADSPHFQHSNAESKYIQEIEAMCFKKADKMDEFHQSRETGSQFYLLALLSLQFEL